MIDAGCIVALATDFNPGSSFTASVPLLFALACIYMKLTPEEAVTAFTINSAAALGREGITGSIDVGKQGGSGAVAVSVVQVSALPRGNEYSG